MVLVILDSCPLHLENNLFTDNLVSPILLYRAQLSELKKKPQFTLVGL